MGASALALLLVAAPVNGASNHWAAVPVMAPPSLDDPSVALSSVSCPTSSACSAVGSFADSSGDREGLVLSEASGRWMAAEMAALPGDAAAQPDVALTSVSCASSGNCGAVGTYEDRRGATQGLLLSEASGHWSKAREAVLPATAAANPQVELASVSCPAAGECTAVGSFADKSGNGQAFALTERAGRWQAAVEVELPPPVPAAGSLQNWAGLEAVRALRWTTAPRWGRTTVLAAAAFRRAPSTPTSASGCSSPSPRVSGAPLLKRSLPPSPSAGP